MESKIKYVIESSLGPRRIRFTIQYQFTFIHQNRGISMDTWDRVENLEILNTRIILIVNILKISVS